MLVEIETLSLKITILILDKTNNSSNVIGFIKVKVTYSEFTHEQKFEELYDKFSCKYCFLGLQKLTNYFTTWEKSTHSEFECYDYSNAREFEH